MALKIVFFYQQEAAGWTETWYGPGTSVPFSLPTPIYNAAKASLKFRTGGTAISYIRISLEGSRKSIGFRSGTDLLNTTQIVTGTPTADVVDTSLLWKITDQNQNHKFMWLRGLNDQDVQRDIFGYSNPQPNLINGIRAYFAACQAATLQIRVAFTPSNTPGFKYFDITKLAPNAGNAKWTDITLGQDPAGSIAVGDKVHILGVSRNDAPGIPRVTIAKAVDGPIVPSVTIPYNLRNQGTVQPKFGKIIQVQYQYNNIVQQEWQYLGEHKTGRPFGQPRGRASVAVRAQ